MRSSVTRVNVMQSLTIDRATLDSSTGPVTAGGAMVTFSFEAEGVQCDGEIAVRPSPTD